MSDDQKNPYADFDQAWHEFIEALAAVYLPMATRILRRPAVVVGVFVSWLLAIGICLWQGW